MFYRCLLWFDPSEPLRTTPQRKQTLGECSTGVRCGSIPPNLFELHLSASKYLERVFEEVRRDRTTPNLHWILQPSYLNNTGLFSHSIYNSSNYTSAQANTCRECSTGGRFGSNPPNRFELHLMDKQTLGTGPVFGIIRSLRTSSNYTNGQANTWRGCSTGVWCGSKPQNFFELHLSASKHLQRVFHRCSVSEPL